MKKLLMIVLTLILLTALFPISANAEEALKAPTVQYKIVNHDKVSLKWNKIEGAESYYIYKRNDETGKYIKKYEVKSNAVTLKRLSPDTEYSYAVVAVKDGVKSRSSNKVTFTTPSEWYYYNEDIHNKNSGYREHYDGSGREESDIAYNINFGGEYIYRNGWIYYTDAADEIQRYVDPYGDYALYKVKNDGTQNTQLYYLGEPITQFAIEGNSVFILSNYYTEVEVEFEEERYIDDEIYMEFITRNSIFQSELYKRSLDDGEWSQLYFITDNDKYFIDHIDSYIVDFIVADNIIYYVEYSEKEAASIFKKNIEKSDYSYKLYKMNTGGTDVKLIAELDDYRRVLKDSLYLNNNYIYYTTKNDITQKDHGYGLNKLSLSTGESEQIFYIAENSNQIFYIYDVELINGYLYIKTRIYNSDSNGSEYKYYRVKCDGTGLTKSDKPFEWRY